MLFDIVHMNAVAIYVYSRYVRTYAYIRAKTCTYIDSIMP
jgi:hypothetical protein